MNLGRLLVGIFSRFSGKRRAKDEATTLRLDTLYAIAGMLSQTLDLGQALEMVLDKVLAVVNVEVGAFYLVDLSSREAVLKAHRGISGESAEVFKRIEFTEGEAERIAQWKEPVFVMEKVLDKASLSSIMAAKKKEGVKSSLATGLWSKGVLRAAMVIGSRSEHRFSPEDVAWLNAASNEVALAIDNAQLHQQAQKLAFTDDLTGLYNQAYLTQQMERECALARRTKSPLSLILIDLDALKQINDRFGHAVGNTALKDLGRIIKASVRATDIAGRWGGDEFAILALQAHSSSGGRLIAERIKSKVEQWGMPNKRGEVRMTISVGIASCPADASDGPGLFQKADEALYRAKRAGRNGICVFSSQSEENHGR